MKTRAKAMPGRAAAVRLTSAKAAPLNLDTSLVAAMMFALIVVPAFLLLHENDGGASGGETFHQLLWSALYLAAGLRLYQLGVLQHYVRRLAPIWIFCGYLLLTALWSVDTKMTFFNAIELLGSTLVATYIAACFDFRDFLRVLALTFAAAVLVSAILIVVFPMHGRADWGAGPWKGLWSDKNGLGAAMSQGIITCAAFFAASTGLQRFLAFLGTVCCFGLLVGSNSITSTIGGLVVIVVICGVKIWQSPRLGGFGRILVIGGVLTAITLYLSGLTMDAVLGFFGRTAELSGRNEMWPSVQDAIAARPVLGWGYNAFFQSEIAKSFFTSPDPAFNNKPPFHAHNSFLQIEIAGGYVGLLLFLIPLAIAWRNSLMCLVRARTGFAFWPFAIILYLTIGSMDETYFTVINSVEWLLFVAVYIYSAKSVKISGSAWT